MQIEKEYVFAKAAKQAQHFFLEGEKACDCISEGILKATWEILCHLHSQDAHEQLLLSPIASTSISSTQMAADRIMIGLQGPPDLMLISHNFASAFFEECCCSA